ncbi:MAG: hypothetical protein HOO88_08545 [Kiritimatiellaceae bacterium]|nr:hypothetical protein [Kiritimatiellaceae bacterium]
MIFWRDGIRGTDEQGRRLLCIQTGFYGAEFDVEKASMIRLGAIRNAPDYETAVAGFNKLMDAVPASSSQLTIEAGGQIYHCSRGAEPWIVRKEPVQNYWVIEQEPGRKLLDDQRTANKTTNMRLREYGRYRQNFEIDRLIFKNEKGELLPIRVRLLVESWPDLLKLSLEIVPNESLTGAMAQISIDGLKKAEVRTEKAEWKAGVRQTVALVIPFTEAMASGGTDVQVTDRMTGKKVPVCYDAALDAWKVQLNNHTYKPAVLNNLDRYDIHLSNPTDRERVFRILFANEMGWHERNLPPAEQGLRDCAGVMGAQMILRDEKGNPLGLPLQVAHNWPTIKQTRKATPDMQPWLDLDTWDYNSWLRYTAVGRIPAKSEWAGRADMTHALWGGVPQASYYFLTLIGWGYYTDWDVAIQGNWGESVCYAIGGYADSDITDMRPLYVRSYDSHRAVPFEWTPNQGGGNFLHYKVNGEKQYLVTRRYTPVPGPCLTRTGFYGLTEDRKIEFRITAEHPRTDDINRSYYRLQYKVLEDTEFDQLAFFQYGSPTYNFFNPKAVAWGSRNGLEFEKEYPLEGRVEYVERGIPFQGDAPWWFSMHRSDKEEGRGDQGSLGQASRGLVVRSWNAVLGGERVEKPHLSFMGTNHRYPGLLAEISPPPELKSLKKGDYVDMQIEVFLVPKIPGSYLGTNKALKESLPETADTWKAAYRQAKGNDLQLNVTHGTLQRALPVEIAVGADGAAMVEVTGGMAYVPFTFTRAPSASAPSLVELRSGVSIPVDQSDHGNDFWQAERDSSTGLYRITYNLNLDTPKDQPQTRRFRFESETKKEK